MEPTGSAAAEEVEARARALLDECVGENLDQLAVMDMRGDGIGRLLHAAARELAGEPLSLAAARSLLERTSGGDRVLFLTGFRVPPWGVPETDGLIGSAVLALALERARGIRPVFVAEPEVLPAVAAAVRGAGMSAVEGLAAAPPHSVSLLAFAAGDDVTGLAGEIAPAACVAIERPGANPAGRYHLALGRDVSDWIAPLDRLYQEVAAGGTPTVAVGDFGNELGMGALAGVVRRETPAGADCGCGCGAGTACAIPADVTFGCSVSDWGAYAIAACISHLRRDPSLLIDGAGYRRVLEAAVAAGAIDGTSTYAVPHIDGVDDAYNARLLETMRAVVAYPNRSAAPPRTRVFRAGLAGRRGDA